MSKKTLSDLRTEANSFGLNPPDAMRVINELSAALKVVAAGRKVIAECETGKNIVLLYDEGKQAADALSAALSAFDALSLDKDAEK